MKIEIQIVVSLIAVILTMLISGIFLIITGDLFNIMLGIIELVIDILFVYGIGHNMKKALGA